MIPRGLSNSVPKFGLILTVLFKDVIGQKEVKEHLIKEIKSDKVSHAQLFYGKTGYGPLPLALAFAQYVLCENKGTEDSCGVCPACHKVSGLQHPDLHFAFPVILSDKKRISDHYLPEWREKIGESPYFSLNDWTNFITDKESKRPIIGTEESEAIIKKLTLKSYEGGYKIMIIWMPEEMNTTCANKLLKILEEPTPKTLFLLLSEQPDSLLQTIISRTQLNRIPRINSDDLSLYLRNKHEISSQRSESIISRAEGDYLEALDLLQEGSESNDNFELFTSLMRACVKKNPIGMFDWAENASQFSREDQKIFLKYCLYMFRQSILLNYTEHQLTKVSSNEDEFLVRFAPFITGNNVMKFMEEYNDAHYHLERNAQPKILFTTLCIKTMRLIHSA